MADDSASEVEEKRSDCPVLLESDDEKGEASEIKRRFEEYTEVEAALVFEALCLNVAGRAVVATAKKLIARAKIEFFIKHGHDFTIFWIVRVSRL